MLGYCKSYQGDVYLDAETWATRRGWKGWVPGSPEALARSREARRWRRLLQLCADDDGVLLFNQDCGYLYFLIDEEALAARDWRRVLCVMQCS